MTLHPMPVTMQSMARLALRCESHAIGSGDSAMANVSSALIAANVPTPIPRLRLMSGVSTANA